MYTEAGVQKRDDWVEAYAPLVKRIAHHMMAKLPPCVQVDDLIQSGMMGLIDAVGRYRETQGVPFETYASQRIRGAMLDELRQADWLPRSLRKQLRKVESAMHTLEQRNKRHPTETELASEMGMSLSDYQTMLAEARGHQLLYYEDFEGDDESHFLDRHVSDPRGTPLDQILDERMRKQLVDAIEDLPEREKMVMGLYYEQELNLREIGAVLGVTESRICQLHSQAISRLRTKLRSR